MGTNQKLKKELLVKLGIQQSALSKRVHKKKLDIPMSTEEATYLIAHENGIKIDKYLIPELVDKIRHLHTSAHSINSPTQAQVKPRKQANAKNVQEIRFPKEFKVQDPLLSRSKLKEATAMAAIYPLLYVFENSLRELIKRVMKSRYGDDWWDKEFNTGKFKNMKQKVSGRMRTEVKNSWHQKRGAHPIEYTDISDLENIIRAKQNLFIPDMITDLDWFAQFMKELYPSRNVICHMNPLESDNIADVKLKLKKWYKMINANQSNIPSALGS